MAYIHRYFQLDTESRKVFDENGKELRLTGNAFRVLVFLCANKSANITKIGDYLDRAKDYDEDQMRQYKYKINTVVGHDVVEYKNGIYSLVGTVEERNTVLIQEKEVKSGHMNKKIEFNIYPAIVASIMLLLCLLPLPYGFYTLLRWVVTAVSVYYAYILYVAQKKGVWMWLLIGIALLFNPLAPVYLGAKIVWNIIDVVVAGFFIGLVVKLRK